MKQCSIMFLLLLPLLFLGCDDDEENWRDVPYPTSVNCRIEFYDPDGNGYELTPEIGNRIKLVTQLCEEEPDTIWDNHLSRYKGNCLYAHLVYFSELHWEHLNNIVFTIGIGSKQLFGDDRLRKITVVCDDTVGFKLYNEGNFRDKGYIKSVLSDDLTISSPMLFEKDEYIDNEVLPIKVVLE